MDRDVTHHDAPKWATTCTTWRDNLSRLKFCVDLKNRSSGAPTVRLIFPQLY